MFKGRKVSQKITNGTANGTDRKDPNNYKRTPTKIILVIYKGQVAPHHSYLMRVKLDTHPYLQKVKLCTNCFRYNHVKSNCKSKQRCFKYGSNEHLTEECQKFTDETNPVCLNVDLATGPIIRHALQGKSNKIYTILP